VQKWDNNTSGGGEMHRVGLSALAQPRLIKGDQPYLRPEINPATRNPGLPPENECLTADAMSSHPYVEASSLINILGLNII
jgi:hypothetical protein